jgi:serine phosphatase RsbU (regulator of sigma subunit)
MGMLNEYIDLTPPQSYIEQAESWRCYHLSTLIIYSAARHSCFNERNRQRARKKRALTVQVNETLLARIPANMFVTCFDAILDPKSGHLSYANAGHDLPYLRRRAGEAEELRARGMPLGLMPGMSYEEKKIELDADEEVLFYSDGLVETHDPEGVMFGFPRLQALVAAHAEESSLGDFLLEELYSFTGEGWEQEDDITLLTLRRLPTTGEGAEFPTLPTSYE